MSTLIVDKNSSHDRLKLLRKKFIRAPLREIAEKLGVSVGYIHAMESGARTISGRIVEKLATEYGVDSSWLTDGVGEPFTGVPGSDEIFPHRVGTQRTKVKSKRTIPSSDDVGGGVVPMRDDFHEYLESFLDSSRDEPEKLSHGYLLLRRHLPLFTDDWSTEYGRYLRIIKSASDLAEATYPNDEENQRMFFDETVLIAMAKSSVDTTRPEIREMARSYLLGLTETEEGQEILQEALEQPELQ